MTDQTAEFFARLEQAGEELLPAKARGTIRFDLAEDGRLTHWFVAVNRGNVLVSRENRPADCVVATEKRLFDRFVTGEAQVVAAYNRNDVTVQGDLPLLLMFRRVLPAPPGTRDPRDRVRARLRARSRERAVVEDRRERAGAIEERAAAHPQLRALPRGDGQ